MDQTHDLYARVTSIRTQAFQVISALSQASEGEDPDPARTLALVRMQAVANSLGRIQGDLCSEPREAAHAVGL